MARKVGEPASQKGVPISLKWPEDIDLPTVYANQLAISYTGQDFYLVFGEAVPPTAVSHSDSAGGGKSIIIKPVVRVAVSHQSMLRIVDAITKNFAEFMKKAGGSEAQLPRVGDAP